MTASNSATLQIVGLGSRASAWASEAVAVFADSLAGQVPAASACSAMLLADERGLSAYGRNASNQWQPLPLFMTSNAENLKLDLSRLPKGRVLLRAGEGRAVVTRLTLPATTRDVLAQVVRNKVESLAPWPVSEVLWGYRTVGLPQNGQLMVDVGIVSRRTVADLLSRLGSAGIEVSRFEIGHGADAMEGIEIDVHGEERRQTMRGRVKAVMSLLAGAAVIAGAYGSYLSYKVMSDIAGTEAAISRTQSMLLNKSGNGGASLQLAAANTLHTRKRESRQAIELLNVVTQLVPDGIWLSTFDLDGPILTIAGRGTEVPAVIETFESSEAFKDVNFASATQREADATTDSFSISAVVEAKAAVP
jgi:hypothetical protein